MSPMVSYIFNKCKESSCWHFLKSSKLVFFCNCFNAGHLTLAAYFSIKNICCCPCYHKGCCPLILLLFLFFIAESKKKKRYLIYHIIISIFVLRPPSHGLPNPGLPVSFSGEPYRTLHAPLWSSGSQRWHVLTSTDLIKGARTVRGIVPSCFYPFLPTHFNTHPVIPPSLVITHSRLVWAFCMYSLVPNNWVLHQKKKII